MGGALTLGAVAILGGLLLALPTAAADTERIFLTDGYRYVPGKKTVDEAAAEVGLALCGTRCNALSADFQSYLMTMGWRLRKMEGAAERVVELRNPFLDGQCICTGAEYHVELYYYRPTQPADAAQRARGR